MGVTQGAGLSLRWFRDQFGVKSNNGDPYDALAAEAAQVEPGLNGALWAPYLMGERTPHLDPDARAALIGLTASHTRAHVVRAIMEGVAFSLRDSFEIFDEMKVPVKTIRLGGAAHVRLCGVRSGWTSTAKKWRPSKQKRAQLVVWPCLPESVSAFGICRRSLCGVVRTRDVIQPDKEAKVLLARQYQSYRAIYPALRKLDVRYALACRRLMS